MSPQVEIYKAFSRIMGEKVEHYWNTFHFLLIKTFFLPFIYGTKGTVFQSYIPYFSVLRSDKRDSLALAVYESGKGQHPLSRSFESRGGLENIKVLCDVIVRRPTNKSFPFVQHVPCNKGTFSTRMMGGIFQFLSLWSVSMTRQASNPLPSFVTWIIAHNFLWKFFWHFFPAATFATNKLYWP